MQLAFLIVSVALNIIGTFLLASEIMNPFMGIEYYGSKTQYEQTPPPTKTPDYSVWLSKKKVNTKIGLALIVFGSVLPIVSFIICR